MVHPDMLFDILNTVIGRGHGITVGSEMSGSVFNVTFENITMSQTGTGIRMKTQVGEPWNPVCVPWQLPRISP